MKKDITELFCYIADDFCQADAFQKMGKIGEGHNPTRVPSLTISEIMTIMLLYHTSPCKKFKYFYKSYLQLYKPEFPNLVSYQRFIALMLKTLPYFLCFLKCLLVNGDQIHFVDATSLPVCHNKRIKKYKIFNLFAKRGKTFMGWFYGLKLHLIINRRGELANFKLTSGNCDDRKPVPEMAKKLSGLMVGDKGYIVRFLSKVKLLT